MVLSEGDRILYSVLSKPFASRFGESAPPEKGSWQVPGESVTLKLNAGGKVVAEERGVHPLVPGGLCELAEEVIGLGRYGKTLTVLTVG